MAARSGRQEVGLEFLYKAAAGVFVLLSATTALSNRTAAQDQPPPRRIANIWNHKDHQPTRSDVRSAEQATGMALSPEQKAHVDDELSRLYRQLLGEKQNAVASRGQQ